MSINIIFIIENIKESSEVGNLMHKDCGYVLHDRQRKTNF